MSVISKRGRSFIQPKNVIDKAFEKWKENSYDPRKNPTGIVNLGTSANGLMFDVIKAKMMEDGFLDDCTESYFMYFGGEDEMADAIAAFLMKYANSVQAIERKNVVIMNGLTTVIHCLGQVLCDEGEALMIPSPLYSGFISDLGVRGNVRILPVHLSSKIGANGKPFHLSVDDLDQALEKAKKEGVKVKGLIITTPNNPLGYLYTKEELCQFMQFAKRHGIHFISDEIYLTTIFGEDDKAVSALSIKENLLDPDFFHVLWGISKDFAANGMRIGGLVSWSGEVIKAMASLINFSATSGLGCYIFSKLLLDEKWLEEVFFPTNRNRLQTSYQYTVKFLDSIEGASYIPTGTGLYVWCDFRQFLEEATFEAESKLADGMGDAGVLLNPGRGFWCQEPGWFRLVFASPVEYLETAFSRLKHILLKMP